MGDEVGWGGLCEEFEFYFFEAERLGRVLG